MTKINTTSVINSISQSFEKIPDHRSGNTMISIKDSLMSAFAIFSLKFPSLLKFDEYIKNTNNNNLFNLYNVSKAPSDTQIRTIIDEINPVYIKKCFTHLFKSLQRAKKLEAYEFMKINKQPFYLMPIDGTGYFSSDKVHGPCCLKKEDSKSGKISYYHQMLTGAIVNPNLKTVIPFAPVAIVAQDGSKKQDCETKALKRYISLFKKNHPKLKVIVCGDTLYANEPLITNLKQEGLAFILGVKDKSHKHLFSFAELREKRKMINNFSEEEIVGEKVKKKVTRYYNFINGAPLNKKSSDSLEVNYLELVEVVEWESKGISQKIKKRFTWVTNITLNKETARQVATGGRARWKIENEVFNTLKNQGYNFEHNYGHGKKNLSENFAQLMTLAFFVDQILEMTDKSFQKILNIYKRKIRVWEKTRNIYEIFLIKSWSDFYNILEQSSTGSLICNSS